MTHARTLPGKFHNAKLDVLLKFGQLEVASFGRFVTRVSHIHGRLVQLIQHYDRLQQVRSEAPSQLLVFNTIGSEESVRFRATEAWLPRIVFEPSQDQIGHDIFIEANRAIATTVVAGSIIGGALTAMISGANKTIEFWNNISPKEAAVCESDEEIRREVQRIRNRLSKMDETIQQGLTADCNQIQNFVHTGDIHSIEVNGDTFELQPDAQDDSSDQTE